MNEERNKSSGTLSLFIKAAFFMITLLLISVLLLLTGVFFPMTRAAVITPSARTPSMTNDMIRIVVRKDLI